MSLNGKIIQRITGVSANDTMHSTGYAAAQNNGSFGAASGTSFTARQSIDQNRKMVMGYRNSRLAQGVNRMPRARSFIRDNTDNGVEGSTGQKPSTPIAPTTPQTQSNRITSSFKPNFKGF